MCYHHLKIRHVATLCKGCFTVLFAKGLAVILQAHYMQTSHQKSLSRRLSEKKLWYVWETSVSRFSSPTTRTQTWETRKEYFTAIFTSSLNKPKTEGEKTTFLQQQSRVGVSDNRLKCSRRHLSAKRLLPTQSKSGATTRNIKLKTTPASLTAT